MEDVAASLGNDSVSMAWLEDAIEHAQAHGQMKALAYLEAVKEDAVFDTEMASKRKGYTGG